MKGASTVGGRRSMRLYYLLAFVHLIALPLASPFASAGPHALQQQRPNHNHRKKNDRPAAKPSSKERHFRAESSVREIPDLQQKNRVRRFFARMRPSSHNDDPTWKRGGEAQAASLLSRLFFGYANPLVDNAAKRRLDQYDALQVSMNMSNVVQDFSEFYDQTKAATTEKLQQQGKTASDPDAQAIILAKSLFVYERRKLLLTAFLRLLNTSVQAFPAILVSRLLRLVEAGKSHPPRRALMVVFTLVAVLMTKTVVENQYFDRVVRTSTEVRGILAGLIFDKSLRVGGTGSTTGNKNATTAAGTGEVMNLMQSDASLIESFVMQIHTTWDGPLQIAVYVALLYKYLGPSVIWGVAVLLVSVPINSVGLRVLNRLTKMEIAEKDARTKKTAESISNMKLLKLQGWDDRFAKDIKVSRRAELRRMVTRGTVKAFLSAYSSGVPSLVLVVTLLAYIRQAPTLLASTIFTAISLFNQLRFPLFFFPMYVDSAANGRQALQRISNYLSSEESRPYTTRHAPTSSGGGMIEITKGNFLWPGASHAVPALVDVEFKAEPGEMVAVVGSVGSGKSAFIKGLLGELKPVPSIVVRQAVADSDEEDENFTSTSSISDSPVVTTHGTVAYCSQEAWLPKGTIRDAIVFGRDFDEGRYQAAIFDAGLDKDLDEDTGVLAHDTDVGEGGSSLSGGQRARVALARALYSDSDETKIFLLDDCLAALDASVGSTVFERVSERIRGTQSVAILVTNDPSIPRRCDRVVLMGRVATSASCSKIVDVGTYDELLSRGHKLESSPSSSEGTVQKAPKVLKEKPKAAHVQHDASHVNVDNGVETVSVVSSFSSSSLNTTEDCHADPECFQIMANCPEFVNEEAIQSPVSIRRRDAATFEVFDFNVSCTTIPEKYDAVQRPSPTSKPETTKKLSSADDAMSAGAVPLSTYMAYFRAVRKPLLIVAMISAYVLSNGASFFQQYTVARWTELPNLNSAVSFRYMRNLVKAAWAVSGLLWLRSFLTMNMSVRAAEHLHARMLSSVFAAPSSFFDATPSGQLLSRFGKEMETVDRSVPESLSSVLFCFLNIFMSVAGLAGVVTPGMIVPLGAVSIMYWRSMGLYRPAARDLKRAETITRSPIYTHFGEAIRGKEIIRSIPGARKRWSFDHRSLTDSNLRVFGTVKTLDRWLSTRLESLGISVVLTAALAAVLLTRSGRLKPGLAGWGLTQALSLTGLMTWAVKVLTDMEANFLSVKRVEELSGIDREGDEIQTMPREFAVAGEAFQALLPTNHARVSLAPVDSKALVKNGWPWRGNIRFSNVSMRYNAVSKLVLKEVSIDVPAGTTLGVVGRTGSGKSSLLLTLFRLVEIEAGGSILIDGVDIRSVGLKDLRQSIAIIPQDPVLFAGSLAYNLDATGSSSPNDMWAALDAASPNLAIQFRKQQGFDTLISEGGKNLSLGQRQLICLARALLRNSRILVMDEATSSVDSQTDQEVQDTIRREFVNKGVTVITVAHRLDTVLGYDKIAVLGEGCVLEYGTPSDLLLDPSGELSQLVAADSQSKRKGGVQAVR